MARTLHVQETCEWTSQPPRALTRWQLFPIARPRGRNQLCLLPARANFRLGLGLRAYSVHSAAAVNLRPHQGWQTAKVNVAARALSASITRAGIWREVLEFVRLPL